MTDAVLLTQEEAEARLAYWQGVLKLADWTVLVEIARDFDMQEEGKAGECDVKLEHRCAKIWLMDPQDYTGQQWFPIDMERVLLHELLHVHFEPLWPGERKSSCHVPEEQAINAIADALIALERKHG